MLAPAERQMPLAAVTAILIGWGVLAYAAIVEGLFYRCRLNRPQLKPRAMRNAGRLAWLVGRPEMA